MPTDHAPGVVAVVLTYESRRGLADCLDAVAAQTRPVDEVLVVDNASSEPVHDLAGALPNGRVLRLAENLGPAGGYAAGLADFRESAHAFAWVIDDDCRPAPTALEALLEVGQDGQAVVFSRGIDAASGARVRGLGWLGVLIPRATVVRAGLPNAELFWWTEDNEYLGWRVPRSGFSIRRCDDAVVTVVRRRPSSSKPAWKYFYEARNEVYHRLWTLGAHGLRPVPHHLRFRVRLWRASKVTAKLAARALVVEREGRTRKVWMVCRGAGHGAIRRLGRTVPADDAHRPDHSA